MATNSEITLAINQQDGSFVAFNGSATSIPVLTQFNTPNFGIVVVTPTGSITTPYTLVDLSQYSLRVSVGPAPQGNVGPTPYITQTSWAYDVTLKKFTGSIPLTNSQIGTDMGAAATLGVYFEINLRVNGIPITVYQGQTSIRAALDEGTSSPPPSSDGYFTAPEINAGFLAKTATANDTKIWQSADTNKKVLQYLGNDGIMHFDPIT